ncbi:hypothetical protein Fleli_1684 [Bernardetia litoralis DSM 6794]|uniref:Uncharacterized protein n=1 Tax=Bernardetia litoralis (strain ATCC 23117 / DSM 6794 / NBRC 15988 / NCIMB 1366 / Fx l1 / Sio-4) TaxID=880071 RepID=I4AJF9_BERLS|nr:DUF6134 family protein [Bernardetia litoralis]AFM04094.1 hypothetical protein Fleli_1684 [Bernardetia litoralis DSM 6794]
MTWYLFLFSFIICQSNFANTTEKSLSYDIILKEKAVGTLYVNQKKQNAKTYYHSSTTIKTRVIRSIEVNYKYDVVFENQNLETADVNIKLNGNQYAETQTQWKANHYQIIKNDKSEALKETIHYSTISMYFKEPININHCYSEQEGDFNKIIALGNHSYKKINSSGKENIYYYKNGNLEKAVIDGGIVSFEMVLR